MKPSYHNCGAGGNINCEHWDDINGCWMDETDCSKCPEFLGEKDEIF